MAKKSKPQGKTPPELIVVPDDYADVDLIGYSEHGQGLVQMIRSVQSKGSFTIGIFGEWGAGKTSMLRQIEKMLVDGDDKEIITVWFNPWQFTGEEHLIIPFFHTIVAALKDFRKDVEKKGILKKAWNKLDILIQKLSRAPIAVAYGMSGEVKIPFFLKAKVSPSKMIDKAAEQEAEIDQKAKEKEEQSYEQFEKDYESLYYNLISELRDTTEGLNIKFVVFIDDLDRCLPEKAVELLEGIKVLLDLPLFVFVIGVAREVIERGIRHRYKDIYKNETDEDSILEREYLGKIIQFPFVLPPAEKDKLERKILRDPLEKIGQAALFTDVIFETLGNNPRTLKRFINNLSYLFWVAKEKESTAGENAEYRQELLVKACLLAYSFHELYMILCNTPEYMLKIQQHIWETAAKNESFKAEQEVESREKTGIGIMTIDKWLKPPHRIRLNAILNKRMIDGIPEIEQGFQTSNEVERHLCLLTPNAPGKDEKVTRIDSTLFELMNNRMLEIPSGTFNMGTSEIAVNGIKIKTFLMDKFPVTQDLYYQVVNKNPSHYKGDNRPVDAVSWYEAVCFCNKLSNLLDYEPAYRILEGEKKVKLLMEANGFRLPSEAEWEYACRAESTGDYYGLLDDIAWYRENSNDVTHPVGLKQKNKFGLYDMLGNICEWVEDDWHKKLENIPYFDGRPWINQIRSSNRVFRGGSYHYRSHNCTSSFRNSADFKKRFRDMGFRVARSLNN